MRQAEDEGNVLDKFWVMDLEALWGDKGQVMDDIDEDLEPITRPENPKLRFGFQKYIPPKQPERLNPETFEDEGCDSLNTENK